MQKKRHVGRLVDVALAFMVLLTAYNTLVRPRIGASDAMAEIGSRPEVTIRDPSSGAVSSLTDEGAGKCRMVVIYDPNCSGCRSASLLWMRDLATADSRDAVAGRGWHVLWLSVLPEVLPADLRPSSDIVPHWTVEDSRALLQSIRLQSVPATMVLDRNGSIVSASAGGALRSLEAFTDRCTIAANEN